ncbi:DUF7218 family protein [Pseudarthrobacter sp. N5]
MPGKKNPSLKDPELHEELRQDGASKQELGFRGYSGKKKSELIAALRNS